MWRCRSGAIEGGVPLAAASTVTGDIHAGGTPTKNRHACPISTPAPAPLDGVSALVDHRRWSRWVSQLRATSAVISLIGGASGCLVAYLAATGEAQGPIYSGWMMVFLVVAVLVCGVGVLGGLLIFTNARVSAALLVLAALAYAGVLLLMVRRYQPEPITAAIIAAGPIAALFVASAVLGALVHFQNDNGD
jgi:hypothetical protein